MLPVGPQMVPVGLQMVPGGPQMVPGGPQMAPVGPQMVPGGFCVLCGYNKATLQWYTPFCDGIIFTRRTDLSPI